MPWLKLIEHPPEFRGWHLCRIGGKDGYKLPALITSTGLVSGPDGKSYPAYEVEYLDETLSEEPDQDKLWDEMAELVIGKQKEEGIKIVKDKYAITRK